MRTWLSVVVVLLLLGTAYAELQNVTVGGIIETRFRYILDSFNQGQVGFGPTPEIRGLAGWFPHRPIGDATAAQLRLDPRNVISLLDWSKHTNTWAFAELATSVNVRADFTDEVTSFIEFYSFDIWGQDFRSDYITGVDRRANTTDDVEVLQSYIETNNTFGLPVRLRIGRQCLQFGKNFLIAEKTTPTQRFSFDAVRATYQQDKLTIDAWWSKLADNSPLEEDGDVDFYGVYGTYAFSDAVNASAYWLLVRDARAQFDTQGGWIQEWLEDVIGLDDYDPTTLHTVGGRLWGKFSGFDYNVDAAYQFGNASVTGVNFKQPSLWGFYGDDDAEYDGNWGADVEVGYTLDITWKPRLFLGGVYFSGEDNRDVSFLEWLNPLDKPQASVSFNRLFSDLNYAPVLQDNGEMSNFKQIRGGVTVTPTEKLWIMLRLQNMWANGTFDWPVNWRVGRFRWPLAPIFDFWTQESDDNMGFHADTIIRYTYNSNLTFIVYYGHLWAGDAVRDGNYVLGFGNQFHGGVAKEDADYTFFWSILKF
ncbi:MAG: alginate export family protein [Candidatus Hydrogenedentes bacterium]|nr:alginate export family protein [Candidatus Hydrogenedentota bacterium]